MWLYGIPGNVEPVPFPARWLPAVARCFVDGNSASLDFSDGPTSTAALTVDKSHGDSMTRTWTSGTWGKRFTRSRPWSLKLDGYAFTLAVDEVPGIRYPVLDSDRITIKRGFLWSSVVFSPLGYPPLVLGGMGNAIAREMVRVLADAREDYQKHLRIQKLLRTFDEAVELISSWCTALRAAAAAELTQQGWLTARFCSHWLESKPRPELSGLFNEPEICAHLATRPAATQNAVRLWHRTDLNEFAANVNERHIRSELVACKPFFDQVEKSPLTDEQARAVICFDDRVQVIAAAGSGKTSTMVAKAGYALHRNLVPAHEILLVAFNKDAADELQERVRNRLTALGFPAEKIVARTFHKFGLDVIGNATGRRPSLAPWLDSGRDIEHLATLVDGLKNQDPVFRAQWDLFRFVFGHDLPGLNKESNLEDWDRDTQVAGFRTLRNEVVKSPGERILANWLYYNGVDYRYEQPYEIDTADPQHGQYRPDFYYPAAKAYHEHWALDQHGRPPKGFHGYIEGVEWKRRTHTEYGTTLLETTMADLYSGAAFPYLERELKARGISLDPNPDRPVLGREPIKQEQLTTLFRTFLTHAKSNCFTAATLRERLEAETPDRFRYRHRMFLYLFERVREAWEASLANAGVIDFEDMLNLASDHLEARAWFSPFKLVMVDEFQDASRARARLIRALVAAPGKWLFAVGDDWQSINRFAGADISVMTEFEEWFGKAQILRLERTFRSPQSLCDVSGQLVQQNPSQLKKNVVSAAPEYAPTVQILEVASDDRTASAIRSYLARLNAGLAAGSVPPNKDGKISVFVLGRYRRDKDYFPPCDKLSDRLDVRFSTIHGSKGLEADYVVLSRVASGRRAFPSDREDDPVLQLAMPKGDDYPHSEERRLFYVALTRARRAVLLVSIKGCFSPFLVELIRDHDIQPIAFEGEPSVVQICPKCEKGTMVPRSGPYGHFLGCSRFPACPRKARRH